MLAIVGATGCTQNQPPISAERPDSATDTAGTVSGSETSVQAIVLPGGPPGISFDDLRFSADVGAVLVPAGRSGNVDLIDVSTKRVTPIGGFSAQGAYDGAGRFGVTSVDHGFDGLFVTDRTSRKLYIVNPETRAIAGSTPLAAEPDHVRYVVPYREVWVTEPGKEQVEVFTMPAQGGPPMQAAYVNGGALVQEALIPIKGGPRSLAVDVARGRVYAHAGVGSTVAIDLAERKVVATWPNGCKEPRGIDLDQERGLLFVGCAEGKAVVLDATAGTQLSSTSRDSGADAIAYSSKLRHLYLHDAPSKATAILGVSAKGQLSLLGTVPTGAGGRCITADATGNVYVCDPDAGRIMTFRDPYPASP
jgi:hypothetical protein